MADKTPSFIKRGSSGLDSIGGRSVYIGLKDGESTEIASVGLMDDIISFHQHAFWLEGGNSPMFPCLQSRDCPGCMLENKPKFRALMLVEQKNEDGQKIFSMGIDLFRQIIDIDQAMDGNLKGKVIRVSRRGSGMNTKWSAMPTNRERKVDAPEIDLLEHIGPTTREAIIELLENAGVWPGDKKKSKAAKSETSSKDDETPWDEVEFEGEE